MMNSSKYHVKRPILFLIDVEPDARLTRAGADAWKASVDSLDPIGRLREALESATGTRVRFNWFLRTDPQIAQTWGRSDAIGRDCPSIIRAIDRHSDFAGIHVHLWRWHADRGEWFNDFTDRAWARECLQTSIDGFTSVFGGAPDATRFGDRWLDQHIVDALPSFGIRYDLSIEPGMPASAVWDDPHANALLPDYRAAPRVPYVPAPANFLCARSSAPEPDDLWLLPLSTSPLKWRLSRARPYVVRNCFQPNLSKPPHQVWPHIQAHLDAGAAAPLTIVVRSGDLALPSALQNFLETTRRLTQHPALADCVFTTPPDVVRVLQKTHRRREGAA